MPPWASEIQPTQITFKEIYIAISVLIFVAITTYLMYKSILESGEPVPEDLFFCFLLGVVVGLSWPFVLAVAIPVLPIWLVANKLASGNRKEHDNGPH